MTELETKLLEALQIAERHLTSEFYGLCYEPSPSEPLSVIRSAIAEAAQQQAMQSSADGWIAWSGGTCPVAPGTVVDVRYRNGDESHKLPANEHLPGGKNDAGPAYWRHDSQPNDIVAYRIAGAPK